jgi:hypothetical protein
MNVNMKRKGMSWPILRYYSHHSPKRSEKPIKLPSDSVFCLTSEPESMGCLHTSQTLNICIYPFQDLGFIGVPPLAVISQSFNSQVVEPHYD